MTPIEAEVLGTFLLVLLGGGVCANTSLNHSFAQGAGWVVVSWGWGLAVFAGVTVAGSYSGAHLNPAVTIGLAVAGEFPGADVLAYIVSQMVGAMLGATAVWLFFYQHYLRTEDPAVKLGTFCTAPAIHHPPSNFFSEMTGTFVLVLAVLSFHDPVIHTSTLGDVPVGPGSLGALPVALLVVGIGMCLGGTTGYAINPARDLGPRIVHSVLPIPGKGGSNWSYAWIPVAGPVAGACIAALLARTFG
jgi:glycerol uptake facilitator protein